MRKVINIFILLVLAIPLTSGIAKTDFETFCDVWGPIYVTDNPSHADFKIYVHDDEAFADVLIFKQDQELFADRSGQWYLTSSRGFARYSVYFVEEEGYADFTIHFTETESFAGCHDD